MMTTTMITRKCLWTLLCVALLIPASCVKAPELTLTSPSSIELSVDGSSGSITFTANRDWTVSCSDSWVTVSPSKGEASKEPVTVTVRCNANTTYDDRTATVTIRMEELSQTVTVRQPANLGVIVSTQSFVLTSEARTIDVDVQANVQYTVETSVDWIKQPGTKGLTSTKYSFSILENTTYDDREGRITIKAQSGGVPDQVITVKQAQKDAIIVKDTSFDMPYGGGEIEFKVEANVAFDVKTDSDWIHYVSTKALSTSTVKLKIDENATFSARSGKVEVTQQGGSLKHTITVNQAGRIAVTSIELDKTSLTLKPEETATLVATVKPDNATDKTVTWTSSDPEIATVDETGKVTAVKDGAATITATAGEKTATCSVKVSSSVYVGNAVDLGIVIIREDGTAYNLQWADCNLGTDKPEEFGDYYAWGETETKDIYTWETYKFRTSGDSYSNVKLSKYNTSSSYGPVDNKTVLDPEDDVAHVKLGGKWRMPTKAEQDALRSQCTWTWTTKNGVNGREVRSKVNSNSIFLPAAGYRYGTNLYRAGSYGGYWSSSVNTYDPGSAVSIDFSSGSDDWLSDSRYYGFTVRPVMETAIPVTAVELDKTSLEMKPGETVNLVATVKPDNATNKTVTWTSSEPEIATVDETGKVTAVKLGVATITAKAGEKTAECKVTVCIPVTSVELDKTSLEMKPGETATLVVTVKPNNATDKTVTWTSSDTSIASVDETGKVTAIKNGSASITAKAGKNTATCGVKVGIPVKSVELNKTYLHLNKPGDTETLVATAKPNDATDQRLVWSSSNTSIVTVDQTGRVTAVKEGVTNIFVYDGHWGSSGAACTVVVGIVPDGSVDLGIVSTRADKSRYPIYWAECNIGASKPEEYGDYYAWGETETKSDYNWRTYKWANGADNKLTKYCPADKTDYWDGTGSPDGKTVLDPEDDVAHVKLGGKWRMPTKAEQDALLSQCTWTWTTKNGVKGYEVKSKVNSNSIFLPAAGYRYNTDLNRAGSYGYYCSSSLYTDYPYRPYNVCYLHFNSDYVYFTSNYRDLGFTVRPVTE